MKSKEWFEDWFDSPYYHILYKDRNDDEAELFIRNLVQETGIIKGANVLDLACGKGRHSIILEKCGYNVLGVDLSPNSIHSAKIFENEHLKYAVHDMRKIIEGKSFSAVFNLFTSFGYFDRVEENSKVIKAVHSMLDEQGIFVIDFMNAHKVIHNLVLEERKTVDGIEFDITRSYNGNHIFKTIEFHDGKVFRRYTERVQALQQYDFYELLASEKFEIIRTFGDFSLNEYDPKLSDRLIIIAQKTR